MSAVLPFDTLIDLVRFKLYEALTLQGVLRPDVINISVELNQRVTSSYIAVVFGQLATNRHVELGEGKNGATARLLPTGIRTVEKQLRDPGSAPSLFRDGGFEAFDEQLVYLASAPASDRVVKFDHNHPAYGQVTQSIAELKIALRENNEVGNLFGTDRDVALQEVEQLEEMVEQAQGRPSIIIAFAKRSLAWLGEKGLGTIVVELSKKLLTNLIDWLS